MFVNVADNNAIDNFRTQYSNQDLLMSACYYIAAEPTASRIYPLWFRIVSNNLEDARTSALEAVFYINENFAVPQDSIELIYNGGGFYAGDSIQKNHTAATGATKVDTSDSEFIISIPPVVFESKPTPLMPALNYHLARQMAEDGIQRIDIDVYGEIFIPLANSIWNSRFVIPLTVNELFYLDAKSIATLSSSPRSEDCLILPNCIPATTEWFSELHKEAEKNYKEQKQLQKMLLERGWQIPPCIRRLHWADLDTGTALEACRIISQFYSFIYAGDDEIWYHILRLANRNNIKDHEKLKAIISFAVESGSFVNCSYPLLRQFCPSSKCYIARMNEEYKNPYLFKQAGERRWKV